ncbi:LysR family transcriptional regulator [Pedobacter petrophilus]|uniref:LysR family transcriptional regulator n=1 Tax=Pedobacter petrophilus TaxID=1908241 RepID=A0A7K0G4M3_9SPHI|nr:LysR family transcriptional regulator [Pedobacter petrophilus]MRX78400.1 LysR family transcriptional regulator [Pedobacter petrophilus]
MNINDLKIFESVASNASFTKAAEDMYTVQSNITARIKALEEELKINLFTRTSRKVVLTEAGEIFLTYSRKINHLLDEAKQELNSTDKLSGMLKIGCIETTMALKIPGVINLFTDKYPGVTLNFTSGNSTKLLNDLLNRKLDAAFVVAPVVIPELSTQIIKKEKLVIITSKSYRNIKDLEKQPVKIIVFDQGCSYRPRLEIWLNNKGITSYQCIILNTLEGIINFVEAGIGITILPDELINKLYYNRELVTYPVEGDLGKLTTVIAYRNDTVLSKAAQVFMALF